MLTKDQIKNMPTIRTAKCLKIDYPNKSAALDDIQLIYTQRKFRSKKYAGVKKANKKLKVYLCNRCGYWHLTSNMNYRKASKRISK